MESGTSIIEVNRLSQIANIYGLTQWSFSNPTQKIPDFDDLPIGTKELIGAKPDRKNTAKDFSLQIPQQIQIVLESKKLPDAFTAADVWDLLPAKIKEKITAVRVIDSFSKGSLAKKIIFTGQMPGRKKLYKLK